MTALQTIQLPRPVVIAHRGSSGIAPENTLPAFRQGIKCGADFVELDYRHTSDGVPVAIHDATLDRTTDARARWNLGSVRVEEKTAEEIRHLDAGAWFDAEYRGTKIPLVSEALECICRDSLAVIERKAGNSETIIRLLREQNLLEKVVLISFDWDFLRGCARLAPELILGALGPQRSTAEESQTPTSEELREIQSMGCRLLVWNREISKESVKAARCHGLRVWIYTINEPDLASQLVEIGVSGIISDSPNLIRKGVESADSVGD